MVGDRRDEEASADAASTSGCKRDEVPPNITESLSAVWSGVIDGESRTTSLDDASHGT